MENLVFVLDHNVIKRVLLLCCSLLVVFLVACSIAGGTTATFRCEHNSSNTFQLDCKVLEGMPNAEYKWNWGDDSQESPGEKTSHVFRKAGRYEIKITVQRYGETMQIESFFVTIK